MFVKMVHVFYEFLVVMILVTFEDPLSFRIVQLQCWQIIDNIFIVFLLAELRHTVQTVHADQLLGSGRDHLLLVDDGRLLVLLVIFALLFVLFDFLVSSFGTLL